MDGKRVTFERRLAAEIEALNRRQAVIDWLHASIMDERVS